MKNLHLIGAVAAALLLGSATTAFAQSTNVVSPSATVASTSTQPLIPGGAAGEPARSPVASFWASLTGDAPRNDAKTSETASTDMTAANAR